MGGVVANQKLYEMLGTKVVHWTKGIPSRAGEILGRFW